MKVPKTFYDNGFVISFPVKNKKISYCIYKWNKNGDSQALLASGKYNNENPKDLITSEIKSEQI